MKATLKSVRWSCLAAAAVVVMRPGAALAQHVPTVRGSADAVTVLPSTHPAGGVAATTRPEDISGMAPLPAGHVPISGTGAGGATGGAMPGHSDGMPTGGALRVVMSQGTKGAAPLGKDSVRVELLAKGVVIKTYLSSVDEKGTIELRGLPLDVAFQPVVTVTHNGAEEQLVGPPMHKYQPAVELEMPVFETTAEKPAWSIAIRQVEAMPMLVDGKTILRVTDTLWGFNPTDRAWTGEGVGELKHTLEVILPAAAANVQYGPGMAEAGAKVVDGKILRGKTMMPGQTQYVFAYDLPVVDGKSSVSFTAPADTTLLALYVPGNAKVENMNGVELGTASGTKGEDNWQLVKGKNTKTGQVVSVDFTGLKVPPPVATQPAMEQTSDLHLPVPSVTPKPKKP